MCLGLIESIDNLSDTELIPDNHIHPRADAVNGPRGKTLVSRRCSSIELGRRWKARRGSCQDRVIDSGHLVHSRRLIQAGGGSVDWKNPSMTE